MDENVVDRREQGALERSCENPERNVILLYAVVSARWGLREAEE